MDRRGEALILGLLCSALIQEAPGSKALMTIQRRTFTRSRWSHSVHQAGICRLSNLQGSARDLFSRDRDRDHISAL